MVFESGEIWSFGGLVEGRIVKKVCIRLYEFKGLFSMLEAL